MEEILYFLMLNNYCECLPISREIKGLYTWASFWSSINCNRQLMKNILTGKIELNFILLPSINPLSMGCCQKTVFAGSPKVRNTWVELVYELASDLKTHSISAHIKVQHKEGQEIAWVVFCRSKWMRHFISTVPDFGRASKNTFFWQLPISGFSAAFQHIVHILLKKFQ